MLKKVKKLLSGPLPTVDAVNKAAATIDIPTLEAALAEAQRKRASLILDGELDAILAAERAVDFARIELERAQVAIAELERRKIEAEAAERRRDRDKVRAEAAAAVDGVTNALLGKGAELLAEIEKLIDAAATADRAAYYASQQLVNAHVDGDFGDDEEMYLPSVFEWLSTPEATALPKWFRARIYEQVREWHAVR